VADWSLVETTIQTWVETLTGLDVVWKGRPRQPVFGDQGYIELSVGPERTVGQDDLIIAYNAAAPAGEEMEVTQEGARTFTLGIQIRTFDQSVDSNARHYASLIRKYCCMPRKTGEVLDPAGVAFARILSDTPVGTIHEGREMSVHQLDLLMNATDEASDTPIGYITTVKDADLETPEGTVVATMDFDV